MLKIKKNKAYVIAEIGINHEGKLSNAIALIRNAKECGADAVKFQVFDPQTIAYKNQKKNFLQKKLISKKETLHKMWERVALNISQLKILKKISKKLKLDFICSIFDDYSYDIIKKIRVDAIKIASADITDVILLNKIKKLKSHVILSTGMADHYEINNAIRILRGNKVFLLHCVSLYPCPTKLANLQRINSLKIYKKIVGYSDHCIGINASLKAISMGAGIIEKHFTLNKYKKGADHILSADKNDLKFICDFAKNSQFFLGSGKIKPTLYELSFRKNFRKGIFFKKDISKNDIITKKHLIIRRPQSNTKIESYYKILGKRINKKFYEGEEVNLKNIF